MLPYTGVPLCLGVGGLYVRWIYANVCWNSSYMIITAKINIDVAYKLYDRYGNPDINVNSSI